MGLQASIGLAVLLGSARATAERVFAIEVSDPSLFDVAALTAALRVRVATNGPPVRVRVTSTADGVLVEVRGATRTVALGGRSGAEAARLVALPGARAPAARGPWRGVGRGAVGANVIVVDGGHSDAMIDRERADAVRHQGL